MLSSAPSDRAACFRVNWSTATARMITTPMTISWAFVEMPTSVQPLRKKLMSSVPTTVPVIVPGRRTGWRRR